MATSEETVTIHSGDGYTFVVSKKAAKLCKTLDSLFSSPAQFADARNSETTLHGLRGPIIEIVLRYCYYTLRYAAMSDEEATKVNLTDFDVPLEDVVEVLVAAHFLDI